MSKAKGPSFVLELKLNTTEQQAHTLDCRFFYAFLMKNRLIGHAKKRLSSMRQNPEYRQLIQERADVMASCKNGKLPAANKKQLSVINNRLKDIRTAYGLSEYRFHAWIAVQQHRYKKHIDSLTAQKIASSVWQSVETVLFRKGKRIHFRKLDDLLSLEGKTNASGIRFKNGKLHWNGLVIRPQIRKKDKYAGAALRHQVKYCRIVRKAMGTRYHYYLQLVLAGLPPKKHKPVPGRVGVDPGTSSEAVYSGNGCILTELAVDTDHRDREVRRIQRKMDRSRRANNPDNYNDDGTVKRGRKTWKNSRRYKHDRMRLKTIRRRAADSVRQSEEILANEILCKHGSDVAAEAMNYKALQARSKKDTVTGTGKHRSKKRFGRSLSRHAPARFLSIINRKLSYIGKEIFFVDTWKFRASQYDHVVGDYKAAGLSERSKTVGGHKVQRDLYSAFLLWAALDETVPDRNTCSKAFPAFLKFQEACIYRLLHDGKQHPSSFGLKDFAA